MNIKDDPGFTPAYAGNTHRSQKGCAPCWVHPRIRGEYFCAGFQQAGAIGSPPHTRGILIQHLMRCLAMGFTPAYAGNTG